MGSGWTKLTYSFKIKFIFKSLLARDREEFVCLLHQSKSKLGASGTLELGGLGRHGLKIWGQYPELVA